MLGKVLPARRTPPPQEFDPIADLDSIVAKPKAFKLFGRWRTLKPLSTEDFLKYVNAVNRVMRLDAVQDLTEKAVAANAIDACYQVFSSVCDDISREEVGRMSLVQATNLFAIITETVTGRLSDEEKKNLLTPQLQPKKS